MRPSKPLHPAIRKALVDPDDQRSDAQVVRDFKKRMGTVCKPCWQLHYCPYGSIVEDFPLPPLTRASVEQHLDYVRECLRTGKLGTGEPVSTEQHRYFKTELERSDPSAWPESLPSFVQSASCRIFGHLCPVFFHAEALTETRQQWSHNRTIPRDVMLRVIRRDGQICQKCHSPVPDPDVEFDHLIPFSKGGRSTTENLRVVHRQCNRKKSDSLAEVLHPAPLEIPPSRARRKRSKPAPGK